MYQIFSNSMAYSWPAKLTYPFTFNQREDGKDWEGKRGSKIAYI